MDNKSNRMSIISLISLIIAFLVFLFWPSKDTVIVAFAVIILFSMIAIVCGFIARSQIKKTSEKGNGMALASIILGFILFFLSAFTMFFMLAIKNVDFNDSTLCSQVNDCIDNNDGTSTCNLQDSFEIPCSTGKLTTEQFKK